MFPLSLYPRHSFFSFKDSLCVLVGLVGLFLSLSSRILLLLMCSLSSPLTYTPLPGMLCMMGTKCSSLLSLFFGEKTPQGKWLVEFFRVFFCLFCGICLIIAVFKCVKTLLFHNLPP